MYENYLRDLGSALTEKALEIRDKRVSALETTDYDKGYQMAMYEIISLMQQQALAFQINLEDINLIQIDPDKDLL